MKKDFKGVASRIRTRIKPENRAFIKKNLAIAEQVNSILRQRGWNQKIFAEKLEKETSEVSKWLSGLHNLTLQSITKMESVLGEDIITTPLEASEKYREIQYIVFKVYARPNEVGSEGNQDYSENASIENKICYNKVA